MRGEDHRIFPGPFRRLHLDEAIDRTLQILIVEELWLEALLLLRFLGGLVVRGCASDDTDQHRENRRAHNDWNSPAAATTVRLSRHFFPHCPCMKSLEIVSIVRRL